MAYDLATLAFGFGLLPLVALVLYLAPRGVRENPAAAWGFLAGAVLFLGTAHPAATLLENKAFASGVLPLWVIGLVTVAGFAVGGGVALGLGRVRALAGSGDGLGLLALATVFLAVHSLGDGYVLGMSYAGPAPPGAEVDGLTVAGTVLHRALEGALVVAAALAVAWRPSRSFSLLLAGLMTVPGAYLSVTILNGPATGVAAPFYGFSLFESALEIGIGLPLVLTAILPRLLAAGGRRWAGWATVGFLALALIHFLVE